MFTRAKSLKQYVLLFLLFLGASFATAQNHDLYGLWVKRAAFGSGGSASINSSTVDEQGNVYVAGTFKGTLNFSDDLCNAKMFISKFDGSGFLIKYSSEGKYLWALTADPTKAGISRGATLAIQDYVNGKLLLWGEAIYENTTALPIGLVINSPVSTPITKSKTTADGTIGIGPFYWVADALQVVNAIDGSLGTNISPYPTGTHNIKGQFSGNQIIAVHWGSGTVYGPSKIISKVSYYNISDGVGTDFEYPGQGFLGTIQDSRVREYISLPNGDQLIEHGIPDNSITNGKVSNYLYLYNNNFTTQKKNLFTAFNSRGARLSADAASNVYLSANYGWGGYNNGTLGSFYTVTDFLGSGQTFRTAEMINKLVIARLSPLLAYNASSWIFQIGGNSNTNTDDVIGNQIKTEGNFTYVLGYFKGVNVEFAPLNAGNANTVLSSKGGYDGFYAVYNNSNGHCVSVSQISGSKDDVPTTMFLTPSADKVLIAGTYNSPLLQTDPSGRLYPISSNGTTNQGFISLYSTNPLSSPSGKASSYGDAPISYGLAVHYVEPCLTLGAFDPAKIQNEPTQNILANSALNDDALVKAVDANGSVNLGTDFQLNGLNLEMKIKLKNTSSETAKLMAWIDFNQNGVFDVGEASGLLSNITPSTTAATLIWTNALTQMKQGRTYLRIRLTTDAIDGTQPSGMFFTGDVEDHLLYFNLYELEKSMKLKNRPIGAKAEIGDTIQYTLTLKNLLNQSASFNLFDPIPDSTRFTKASNGVTAVTNVAMAGKSVPSVVWNPIALAAKGGATDNATRTFEVVVTGKPVVAPHTINNIAFAVRSTDTINSATATCQTWPVVVSGIKAVRDNVSLLSGQSINVPFLKNDIRGACANTPLAKVDTIKSTWGHIGSFVVNKVVSPSDTSLVYTPATGKFGIDSLTYYIKCGADSSANKVYLMVHKPLSLNYSACPGAAISIGFTPIAGVEYNWYSVPIGGTIIIDANNKNSIVVTQGGTSGVSDHDYGTWYVEPVYKGVKYPRVEVVLNKSESCGGNIPAECAKNGTVIFTENFGGTSLSDPKFRPTGLGSDCSFTYLPSGDLNTRETYTLTSDRPSNNYLPWDKNRRFADHTPNYPLLDTDTVGYYLMARYDGYLNDAPQQFYQKDLTDLCAGTKLYFSVWALNFNKQSWIDDGVVAPNLRFELLDPNGNIVAYYASGKIINTNWAQYGFDFRVPAGLTSLKLRIINNVYTQDGLEMGLALDDIEVRFCAPPAVMVPAGRDTLVCDGGEFKFNVKYNDNGTAFVTDVTNPNEELAYQIEYKQKYTDTWATYTGTGATGTIKWTELRDNGVEKTFTSVAAADAGYYRVVIAAIGGLEELQCRVISDFVNLMVKSKPVAPDVRVQLCPDPTPLKVLNLSSYLHPTDTTSNWKVNWKNVSPIPYTPAVDPTTGNVSLAFASGTHTYHYKLENKCGADSARFYVTTLKGSTIQMPPQRVVVCKDMAHSLHIQQMMGVEARGTITAPALTAAQIKLHLTTISSLPFKGAVLFNGFTAWDDPGTEKITYNNKPATRVVFTYTAADDSCLTQKVYTLEVIITENILN